MGDTPERLNTEASFAARCGASPIEYSSGRRRTRRLTAAATGRRTPPCTASCSPGCVTTRAPRRTTNAAPRRTTNAAPRKARPDARSSDASSDMRPARSSTWSDRFPAPLRYRGVRET
ncbi:hypothetical protein [Streptomyces sp. FBKL.4005]|uniref:hypothetical protein n=1 Tax=Streptomyces sp. FBKL.4005 TaxID=2015515 RepID=UPI0021D5325C|nr:hypothetical protein [Streptomyces sp. FBKL.4005]